MVRYTCDGCGRDMSADDSCRHIVRIEVRPANSDWQLTEDDLTEDNLEKVSELLQRCDELDPSLLDEERPVRRDLDLCGECRDRFVADPVGIWAASKLGFSAN